MTTQRSLFTPAPPDVPYREVATSIKAARYMVSKVPSLEQRCLELITKAGARGMTADELCVALNAKRNSIAPRLTALGPGTSRYPGKNLIKRSDRERAIEGQNTPADVWVAVNNQEVTR